MKVNHRFLIVFALLIPTLLFSDDNTPLLKQLNEKLSQFLKNRGEESVYIKTDKPFYANGEDIWLSAFIVDATTNKPTAKSEVVYVVLKDPKGNVVDEIKIAIQNGIAKGDFHLRANGAGGIYTIEGYTQWMKNFGNDRFFRKELHVQKVITPNLLLRPDFERKAYGPSDEVMINLKVADLENNPGRNAKVTSIISVEGAFTDTLISYCDDQGEASIKFVLPAKIEHADGTINMLVSYGGVNESVFRNIPIVLNKISLSFYPEGGNAIYNGLESRIAFEAVNEYGKGADIEGEIVDEAGNLITDFRSFHYGMGAFKMQLEEGKKYYARILRPLGNDALLPLPLSSGKFSLNLRQQTQSETEWDIYSPEDCQAAIVTHVHGIVYHNKTVNLKKGLNTVKIRTSDLPAGIAVVTLFDSKAIEQCERLVFVNDGKKLNISLKTDQKYYNPQDSVKLTIKTTDEKGAGVKAGLALSVVDDRLLAFADDKQNNILSYLLLSSELKGEIHEPSFYFKPEEKKSSEAIDYLLLTHGWRRFTWKDVKEKIRIPAIPIEKNNCIIGFITNKKGEPHKSEVILIEEQGKKRFKKISTANEGQFMFTNVDPTSWVWLITKYPNQVNLWEAPNTGVEKGAENKSEVNNAPLKISTPQNSVQSKTHSGRAVKYESGEKSHSSYVGGSGGGGGLSEMVVVGYGVSKRGGSSVVDYNHISYNLELENLLTGQHVNIFVPAGSSNIGSHKILPQNPASLYGINSDMLVVVNDAPLSERMNENFTLTGNFNMDEISSIKIINSVEGATKYGSRGNNGVVEIKTKKKSNFQGNVRNSFKRPKFNGVQLSSVSNRHVGREYYVPPIDKKNVVRSDFRTTVFWSGEVVTNEQGDAEISFPNNDANSAFRITAEGLTDQGLIGRAENSYSTTMPLSLEAKLPNYMNFEDRIVIPVGLRNTTDGAELAKIWIDVEDGLVVEGKKDTTIAVAGRYTEYIYFTVASKGKEGNFKIKINLNGTRNDEIEKELMVKNIGFPKTIFIAGNSNKNIQFNYDDIIPGSLNAEAMLNVSTLNDLFFGKQSIVKRPYGCFEQVSSSNYPNILAAQWLKTNKPDSIEAQAQLKKFMAEGYTKLCSYEIAGGGFEWFGNPPAHSVLTAYGLIQFHELKEVFDGVDIGMLNRTHKFLIDQRKGDGTFIQNNGKYGFQAATNSVNNAYITYVLAEVGTKDIVPEYTHALDEVLESKDMYRMALMANAAFCLGKTDDYQKLIDIFLETMEAGELGKLKMESSIVQSSTVQTEALAHWTIALIRGGKPNMLMVDKCLSYIYTKRVWGGFGSTQATALCLKAITLYTQNAVPNSGKDAVTIKLNEGEKMLRYDPMGIPNSKIEKSFFDANIRKGTNVLSAKVESTDNPIPYTVNLKWDVKTPEKNPKCPFTLTIKLSGKAVRLNETVRLMLALINKEEKGQSMSMIEVGIPAGLSIQPIQMKELKEKGVFDFYEIIENRLVFYFRELGPKENREINIDLKADIPGLYIGAASSAYLYYDQDVRYWIHGEKIDIKE